MFKGIRELFPGSLVGIIIALLEKEVLGQIFEE